MSVTERVRVNTYKPTVVSKVKESAVGTVTHSNRMLLTILDRQRYIGNPTSWVATSFLITQIRLIKMLIILALNKVFSVQSGLMLFELESLQDYQMT